MFTTSTIDGIVCMIEFSILHQLQERIVTLDVMLQIKCFGHQIKAGYLRIRNWHLTIKTNQIMQCYMQIEFMYQLKYYYIDCYGNSKLKQVWKQKQKEKKGNKIEQEVKEQ